MKFVIQRVNNASVTIDEKLLEKSIKVFSSYWGVKWWYKRNRW